MWYLTFNIIFFSPLCIVGWGASRFGSIIWPLGATFSWVPSLRKERFHHKICCNKSRRLWFCSWEGRIRYYLAVRVQFLFPFITSYVWLTANLFVYYLFWYVEVMLNQVSCSLIWPKCHVSWDLVPYDLDCSPLRWLLTMCTREWCPCRKGVNFHNSCGMMIFYILSKASYLPQLLDADMTTRAGS